MSDKERMREHVISDLGAEVCELSGRALNELGIYVAVRSGLNKAYDAGYAAALERAAEIARELEPQGDIRHMTPSEAAQTRICDDIASAIEREKSLPR